MDGEWCSGFSRAPPCTDMGLRLPWLFLSCVTLGKALASLVLCFCTLK